MEQDPKIAEAENFKVKGNEAFKANDYTQAILHYSEAIKCMPEGPKAAIYYSNRAFAHMKLENYGLAISDSDSAISLDPSYPKAYYRKADAHIILNKYEIAKDCLKKVVIEMKIKDKDATEKFNFVKKVLRERAFSEAIFVEEKVVTIDPDQIQVEESYTGPSFTSLTEVTPSWVSSLMSHMQSQKKLHLKYLIQILNECKAIFSKDPNLVSIEVPSGKEITVCGDTHGQFYDLLHIFQLNGNPSEDNPYLFNGDFVDRGSFSLEVILCLLAWKVACPCGMFLTRGNHETRNMNKIYGFEGEVSSKYNSEVYEVFCDLFCKLPLGCLLNQKVLVLHGGLFASDGVKLEDIQKVNRFREPPDSGIMCDMLWADPCKTQGRAASKRGISMQFGPDVAHRFLDENKLKLLVRSHEMKEEGYEVEADGRVITIFSAPNYCDQMKNKGAFIRFGADMTPKYTQFSWVDHPNVPAMTYARNFMPYM